MACFSLHSIGLIVAAYSISKLIKKLNTLCYFPFLVGKHSTSSLLGGCKGPVLALQERGTDFLLGSQFDEH